MEDDWVRGGGRRTTVEVEEGPSRRESCLGALVRGLVFVAIIGVGIVVGAQPQQVQGNGMTPTLRSGQIMLVRMYSAFGLALGKPQRGDIVTYHPPGSPQITTVGRIIAVPGDTIAVTGALVLLNGQPLSEPYANTGLPTQPAVTPSPTTTGTPASGTPATGSTPVASTTPIATATTTPTTTPSGGTPAKSGGTTKGTKLGANQYYILSDNRVAGHDSRSFGPVPGGNILGREWTTLG